MSLKFITTLFLGKFQGGSGGGSATEVALLSVTTAPSGSFAVGSKYYDSTEKKIYTAVTADTWTGATSSNAVFNVIYTYDSGYYIWDGDNLVSTDVDAFIKGATVNGVSVVDANKIAVIPTATDTILGVVQVDGTTITATDGVISALASSPTIENVMYFAPTGAGTEDGSSWENAKAFNQANYDAMTAGYTALLKYGTYTVSWGFDTIKGKNIIGGFTGVGTEKVKPYVVSTDGVWGASGNTAFNDYATIFTQDSRTKIQCYVEGIVFYRHRIQIDNVDPTTSAGEIHNCIVSNNDSESEIKRGVEVSDTLFINGYRVSADADESASLFVYFSNCQFKNTRDTNFGGGGILSYNANKKVYVTNCKFENTQSSGIIGGGACRQCTVTNSVAIGCNSTNHGGAFFECTLTNCSAIGCTANVSQGAFAVCTIDNCYAIGCTAPVNPVYYPPNTTGTPTITPTINTNTVFTQTEDKTIANSDIETSLVGAGVGSMTLPAYFLDVGKTLHIRGMGYLSGASGVGATVKVKLGETALISSTSTYPKLFEVVNFEFDLILTCRTIGETGTVIAEGKTTIFDGLAITTSYDRPLQMTAVATINTTASQLLDLTYTFDTADAGNTITMTNLIVETLN